MPTLKPAAPAVRLVAVPEGTVLDVVLSDALSSAKSAAGDKFEASLAVPVVIGGTTVLRKGAGLRGHVVDA